MVSPFLAQIGIPVLVQILSDSLGRMDHPAAQSAARALGDLDEALARGQIPPEQMAEAHRHAEQMAVLKAAEIKASLTEINKSLRAEIASEDKYVRRMRPTFGYLMALTWTAQMLGLAYVIVFRTGQAHIVLQAVESLSLIWTVGLSVLGIYVYKRSEEKRSGLPIPSGILTLPFIGRQPRTKKLQESITDPAQRTPFNS